jgi:CelD/BcsL family acetyltransferase involved in cellulose biosynthesis
MQLQFLSPVAPQRRPDEAPLSVALEILRSPRDFDSLEARWGRRLFESALWQRVWLGATGKSKALRILVASRDDLPIGLVPLYEERVRRLILSTRVLRLVGRAGAPGEMGIGTAFARGAEVAAAHALAQAMLRMTRFDVLQLGEVEANSPLLAPLAQAAETHGARLVIERFQGAPCLELPESWNAYLKSLASERRARIRHRRAALAGRFSLAHQPNPAEPLRLYRLEIAGRLAAKIDGYRQRDTLFVVHASGDEEARAVLVPYIIENAIGEGVRKLDFIACAHACRDERVAPRRDLYRLSAFRRTIGAAAYRAQEAYLGMTRRSQ